MKISLGLNVNETPDQLVKKGRLAEDIGIDTVWIGDLPNERYAPAMAALLAEQTKRITIGVGLLSPLLHNPEHIASSIRTLNDVYGQRFELLIGPGDRAKLHSVGIEPKRPVPELIVDALDLIRKIFHKYGIPCRIFLGAQGPRMLTVAKNFDGVLINLSDIEMISWAVNRINVDRAGFETGIFAPSYIYTRIDEKIEKSALLSATVVAKGVTQSILERFHIKLSIENIENQQTQQELTRFCIIKNIADFRYYIATLEELGIEQITLSYPQNYSTETIKELETVKDRNTRK